MKCGRPHKNIATFQTTRGIAIFLLIGYGCSIDIKEIWECKNAKLEEQADNSSPILNTFNLLLLALFSVQSVTLFAINEISGD